MGSCSIIGCKSNKAIKDGTLSFHLFPSDPERRKEWVVSTGRKNWVPAKNSRICSVHFDANSIISIGKSKHLKPFATPTKYLKIKTNVKYTEVLTSSKSTRKTQDTIPENEIPSPLLKNLKSIEMPITGCYTRDIKKNNTVSDQNITCDANLWKEINESVNMTNTANKLLLLKLEKLKQMSERRLKKLRAVRLSRARLLRKVAKLETILLKLRNRMYINPEEVQMLKNIDPGQKDLKKRLRLPKYTLIGASTQVL